MEDILSQGYTVGHKAFLQAILARGTMTFEEARPILAAIFNAGNRSEEDREIREDEITEDDFLSYLDVVSQVASLFDYEIRSCLHQTSRKRTHAIVNTASDPQTQLATTFLPDEMSFIKRVLDAIFDKHNTPRMEIMAITSMQAIKLARPSRSRDSEADEDNPTRQADRGLKHSEVEMVLANLIGGGWMDKSRAGFYSMSQRALLELRPWLVDTFNDPDAEPDEWQRIKFCKACKDLVTIGLRCSEPSCNLRLHDGCQDAFWRTQRGKTCPQCSKPWTGQNFVGERAVTMTEAYQRGRRKSGGKRRSTLADQIIEDDDEE